MCVCPLSDEVLWHHMAGKRRYPQQWTGLWARYTSCTRRKLIFLFHRWWLKPHFHHLLGTEPLKPKNWNAGQEHNHMCHHMAEHLSKGVVINGKKFDSAICLHQVKPNFRLLHKTLQVKMKLENGGLQRRAKAKPFLQATKLAKIVGNRYYAHFPYWHLMILDSVTSPSLFNSETNSLV